MRRAWISNASRLAESSVDEKAQTKTATGTAAGSAINRSTYGDSYLLRIFEQGIYEMPKRIEVTPREQLARLVAKALGPEWGVDVDEVYGTECRNGRVKNEHNFKLFVIIYSPKCLSTSMRAKTLQALANKAQDELLEQIQEEFNRMSVYWQRPESPDVLGSPQLRLTQKPAALTHEGA